MEKIIDGVDVSKCKLYDYGICASEMAINLNCEDNKDCYYKQVKRLEKENEQLKKENKELTIHPVTAHYDIKRLKEEKEALQSSINLLKKDFEQLEQENEELKEATDGLLKIQYALADSCNKKETALEEIKEIADIIINTNCNYMLEAQSILKIIRGEE